MKPRANCYKIDSYLYAEKPRMDPDVVFIAVYIVGAALTVGFLVWCVLS